jgi:hypothetical protein
MSALALAVKQGKALYAASPTIHRSNRKAARILKEMGNPLPDPPAQIQHAGRWVENGLLDVLGDKASDASSFHPWAGLLTDRYLKGIPRIRVRPNRTDS